MDAVEELPGLAELLCAERICEGLEGFCLQEARVRDHQRLMAAHLQKTGGQLRNCPRPEQRRRREGEAGKRSSHPGASLKFKFQSLKFYSAGVCALWGRFSGLTPFEGKQAWERLGGLRSD